MGERKTLTFRSRICFKRKDFKRESMEAEDPILWAVIGPLKNMYSVIQVKLSAGRNLRKPLASIRLMLFYFAIAVDDVGCGFLWCCAVISYVVTCYVTLDLNKVYVCWI